MARMTHLIRRGAVYWFRFKLPTELARKPVPDGWPATLAPLVSPATGDGGGRRLKVEITRSLGTKDAKAAKRSAAFTLIEVEQQCEAARRFFASGGVADLEKLTPERALELAENWRAALLVIDEETRKTGLGLERPLLIGEKGKPREPGMSGLDLMAYRSAVEAQEARASDALARSRPLPETKKIALAMLEAAAIAIPPEGSAQRRDLELAFAAAERKALKETRARLDGEVIPTPPLKAPKKGGEGGPTLTEAFKRWAEGNPAKGAKKPSEAATSEGLTALRRFVELHGDLPIAAITKGHARALLDALARVPKNLPPELSKLPLPKLLAHRDLSKYPPRSAATVNKAMQILGGVLTRAEKDGFFDAAPSWANPFHISIAVNALELEPYQPFTIAELNKLFASPVYSQGERPKGGKGDAAYWLPLLALFTGARRTELMQLASGDVKQDSDCGVWFLDFHNAGGNRLKTVASRRQTPVHSSLVGLGFLDYVASRVSASGRAAPLFTELAAPLAPKAKAWSKWFGRYLSDHAVDHPAKCFHSFRGTFKRFARAHGEEHAIDAMVGHASKSVGRGYGRAEMDASGALDAGFPMRRLAAEMEKVDFPGLVLPAPDCVAR